MCLKKENEHRFAENKFSEWTLDLNIKKHSVFSCLIMRIFIIFSQDMKAKPGIKGFIKDFV